MADSPKPDRRAGVDRATIRAVVLCLLVAVVFVTTDLLLQELARNRVVEAWAEPVKEAIFALVVSMVLVFWVRRYVRRWQLADASARASDDALRRSEDRYRSLVESVPGVVWLNEVDRDDPGVTHCVYVGPQIVELLGYTQEEWMTDHILWRSVIHPDDLPAVRAENHAADTTGTLSMEYRAFRRGGGVVWIHDEAVLIPAEEDRPAYWQGIMVDITAARVQDEALHELTESLRGVYHAAPLAILVLEPDGRVRHWNPAAEQMFGWAAAEVLRQPLPYVPPDKVDEHARLRAKTLQGEAIAGFETTRMRKDGSRVDVSLSTAALVDGQGRVTGLLGILEDISERKGAEERLRATLDAAPEAMIGVNGDGVIVMVNEATEAVFGHRRDQLLGQSLEILVPERFRAIHREHVGGYFGEPKRRPMGDQLDLAGRRADGTEFPAEIGLSWIETAEGIVTLAAIRDVTENRRIVEDLASRERQLEALAGVGLAALEGGDLQAMLDEATSLIAGTLGVPLTGFLELLPDEQGFALRSGVGWASGLVGSLAHGRAVSALASYVIQVGEPVIVEDLASERRFPSPAIVLQHGAASGIATVVYGEREPRGVLEVFATERRAFTPDEIRFLQGVAATIGLEIERDRAQATLRAAEAKYRGLAENGPAIVYLHDPHDIPARLTYIGPQIEDLLGYPRQTWTDDPLFWTSVVHPEDRQRVLDADALSIEHEAAYDIEYRFLAIDGREVWVQDRGAIVRTPDGEPLGYQGFLQDVSDRRRIEEERELALGRQLRLSSRLELLHQIDRDVLSSTQIDQMAGRALDHLRMLIPYDRASVVAIDPEGRFSYIAIRSPGLNLEVDLETEVPDEVVRDLLSHDTLLIPDLDELQASSPMIESARRDGIRSGVSIALRVDEGQLGALILTSRTVNAFDPEAVDIVKEVGAELAVGIWQTRLRQAASERAEELGRVAEERQQMLHRIVRAQEEERERVALELHDGLGQILTSISLFASDLHEEVGVESKPRAMRVNDLARRAIADSRQLVWSLRPPELERLGLVPALRRLADEVSLPDVTVDLLEEIGDVRLEPESEAVVYRVVQEAVHNAQKHAGASAISILLQRQDGLLTTLVEDNGRGFDPSAIPTGRGLGLIGMRERAELVRGSLVVESATDAGTRVRLLVPIGATEIEGGEGAVE